MDVSYLHILKIIVFLKSQLNIAAGWKLQPPAAVSIIRKVASEEMSNPHHSSSLRHYLHY